MIIAGWLLAILGLAQVVYAASLDVTQLEAGNALLGLSASIVPNADLIAQRAMVHQGGCITFLAGAVFIAAAYLKPPPSEPRDRTWTSFGAIAAGVFLVVSAAGFGLFIHNLQHKTAARALSNAARLKDANAQAAARMLNGAQEPGASGAPAEAAVGAGGGAED